MSNRNESREEIKQEIEEGQKYEGQKETKERKKSSDSGNQGTPALFNT
jgi:hypothetical protein